jgi:carbon-monoxide dehydrogenase large subunit
MVATLVDRRVPRIDGPEKVSGAARYSADVRLPGLLLGVALRSPFPHARIASLDVSRARVVPGVHAILKAADLPDVLLGKGLQDMPPLARDRVRFVGEKVAVVAAESRDAAEEAIAAIEVGYDELPAVFEVEDALRPDAPIIHPDYPSYIYGRGREVEGRPDHPNANSEVAFGKGDVEAGFRQSARVFEDVFRVPMQHVGFIEPHSCTVTIRLDGKVLVWSCVKQPYGLRDYLAHAIGLDAEQIVTMPARIGGDFGGKGYIVDEALAYYLARATGRPVQMVMTQNEEFTAGVPRHGATIRLKSGVDAQGRLMARDIHVIYNSGAYAGFRPNVSLNGVSRAAGAYRVPHVRIVGNCVYTNHLPCGHMRAPGQPQVTFAVESHTDMIARRLGMDPVDFRQLNVMRSGDEDPVGKVWQQVTVGQVLQRAATAIKWGSPKADGRGRGLAVSERGTGGGRAEVAVEIDSNGQVLARTGVPDVGTGAHTVIQQVVARTLGLPPSAVRVEQGDTDSGPWDQGSGGSHVTNATGGAALVAAEALRQRLCGLAAEVEGWQEGSVSLEDGHFVADGTQRVIFHELAGRLARLEGGLLREITDHEGERGEAAGYACHAVEVAVDRETGKVTIDRIVAVHDVGYAINLIGLTGQIEGGLMQGLGMGAMEDLRVVDGRVQAVNFGDYKLPSVADAPALTIDLIENEDGPAPFGGKGIGEITATPTAPAIANAVEDAVGVRITDLPVTAEKIYAALHDKS